MHIISQCLHGHNSIGLVVTLQKHIIYKYFIYLFSIAVNKMCNERYLLRSTLFNVPKNAAVSQAASPFCVYTMEGAPGVSHVISAPTYLCG